MIQKAVKGLLLFASIDLCKKVFTVIWETDLFFNRKYDLWALGLRGILEKAKS